MSRFKIVHDESIKYHRDRLNTAIENLDKEEDPDEKYFRLKRERETALLSGRARRRALTNKRAQDLRDEHKRAQMRAHEDKYPGWGQFVRIAETPEFQEWYKNLQGYTIPKQALMQEPGSVMWWMEIALEREAKRGIPKIVDESIVQYWQRRKLRIKEATPAWFDKEKYNELIRLRNRNNFRYPMNAPYHIDHIIPLQGQNVCGLHVHTNMRVIRGSDNVRKSNCFPEEGLDIMVVV